MIQPIEYIAQKEGDSRHWMNITNLFTTVRLRQRYLRLNLSLSSFAHTAIWADSASWAEWVLMQSDIVMVVFWREKNTKPPESYKSTTENLIVYVSMSTGLYCWNVCVFKAFGMELWWTINSSQVGTLQTVIAARSIKPDSPASSRCTRSVFRLAFAVYWASGSSQKGQLMLRAA